MIKLIKQRNSADCGHCCLAMALRKPYAEVVRLLGHNGIRVKKPLGTISIEMISASYKATGHFWPTIQNLSGYGRPGWIQKRYGVLKLQSCKEMREIIINWSRNPMQGAIISLPSLNIKGAYHFIYFHNGKVFDPSTRKTNKSIPAKFGSTILTRA